MFYATILGEKKNCGQIVMSCERDLYKNDHIKMHSALSIMLLKQMRNNKNKTSHHRKIHKHFTTYFSYITSKRKLFKGKFKDSENEGK